MMFALITILLGFLAVKDGGSIIGAAIGIEGNLGLLAAPVAGNLTINSSSNTNTSSENLTLYWDITDTDGDDVKNITNWLLNGTSIAVLNMPFENASGNQSGDYSGYENNATLVSGPTWNATGGYDGNGAYEFDGNEDFINISHSDSINFDSSDSYPVLETSRFSREQAWKWRKKALRQFYFRPSYLWKMATASRSAYQWKVLILNGLAVVRHVFS